MLFLNSEVVQQQKCLLTRVEIDEIHALLRGRVAYKRPSSSPNEGCSRGEKDGRQHGTYRPSSSHRRADFGGQNRRPFRQRHCPDLQITHGQRRREKEKRQEPEVEEVLTLKRTKRSSSSRSSGLQEGLRERDTVVAALVDWVRDRVSGMESIMDWSCDRLGEQIAEDILRLTHTTTDLFCRARVLENIREKEAEPLQKQICSVEIKIKELEEELAAAETRSEKAKKDLATAEGRAEKA
nr:hypothetical protein Iba_chr09dCG7950 [Ipomoea batatas]